MNTYTCGRILYLEPNPLMSLRCALWHAVYMLIIVTPHLSTIISYWAIIMFYIDTPNQIIVFKLITVPHSSWTYGEHFSWKMRLRQRSQTCRASKNIIWGTTTTNDCGDVVRRVRFLKKHRESRNPTWNQESIVNPEINRKSSNPSWIQK